jgi:hypothetical protein
MFGTQNNFCDLEIRSAMTTTATSVPLLSAVMEQRIQLRSSASYEAYCEVTKIEMCQNLTIYCSLCEIFFQGNILIVFKIIRNICFL